MADSVAGVVLAAGGGTRLAPLTHERPKALCPVGGRALVDQALTALASVTDSCAVNAHHRADALVAHLAATAPGVHISVEPVLLGTGGALGHLRPWIAGRPLVVVNADAVHGADLAEALADWDGERIRMVAAEPHGAAFGPRIRLCAVAMPWAAAGPLAAAPASVYDQVWAPWAAQGRVEVRAGYTGPWFDCGTPADYLAANLWAGQGRSVVGTGARVEGSVERAVVWDGAVVRRGEHLVDAVRTTEGRTVLVRWRPRQEAATTRRPWGTS